MGLDFINSSDFCQRELYIYWTQLVRASISDACQKLSFFGNSWRMYFNIYYYN